MMMCCCCLSWPSWMAAALPWYPPLDALSSWSLPYLTCNYKREEKKGEGRNLDHFHRDGAFAFSYAVATRIGVGTLRYYR